MNNSYDINSIERFIPKVTDNPNKNNIIKQNEALTKSGFDEILNKSIIGLEDKINISSHAKNRILEDSIKIDKNELNRISSALDKLETKGSKESLLIGKDYAMIASVNNRTIITAMSSERASDNVWTNIDSAVVV